MSDMLPEEELARRAKIHADNEELIRAYHLTFTTPHGRTVMHDLMKFCCFNRAANGDVDEGKRRAFLHIVDFTELTEEQLYLLYSKRNIGELR